MPQQSQIPKVKVLICMDEPICVTGLQVELDGKQGFHVVGACYSFEQLEPALQKVQPDAVVIGLAAESTSLFSKLDNLEPSCKVILWGRDFSPELAKAALDVGVSGFLSSTASADMVRKCIRLAVGGQIWMDRSLSTLLLNNRPIRLSKRQTELLSLLIRGLKNREIAGAMGLSEGTVKSYLTKLFEKVGARDRFELALYGLRTMGKGQGVEAERMPPHAAAGQKGAKQSAAKGRGLAAGFVS